MTNPGGSEAAGADDVGAEGVGADATRADALRADAMRILAAGLAGVNPTRRVAEALTDDPVLAEWGHEIAGGAGWMARDSAPGTGSRTYLLAVGKAALAMTRGALQVLGDAIDEGLVLAPGDAPPDPPAWLPGRIRLHKGAHPLPDEETVQGARQAAQMVYNAQSGDRLLVLLSGGGSSLLTLPAPGLTVDDVRRTAAQLMNAGWSIEELNTVRPALERLKDGGLAALARPARVLGLILSDVVGDDPAVVASGPLSPVSRGSRAAETLLRRRGCWDGLPEAVKAHLLSRRTGVEAGSLPGEVPEATGWEPVLRGVGTGEDAVTAAATRARSLGYRTQILDRALEGEARRVGRGLARVGLAVRDGLAPPEPPACLLASGETTVTVTGTGKGGPNQEVALGGAALLRGRDGVVVASLGTDGIDGPTDAAGGLVDGATVARAHAAGRQVQDALDRNDAYGFLEATGDLIHTGPTGTNVADLMLVLIGEG